ncbi:DMT family transporter [archaeon]|mgnify:CR=1 FL=1|jgi:drug/metabolite transporter (DMT)-like permease|nr:DMT family transporter [archaeon]MBT4352398.1 DMT family transporter [archaeon]MBT4647457.1 DMT family transporter [archaeon]MBT6822553.1 DMT family transporter [archaeon]MBT7392554.1 DMT family transporter [archaeon]
MKKHLNNGSILIVLAAILWALDGIIRRNLYVLPAIIIVFYEHIIGVIIISPFVLPSLFKKKIFTKKIVLLSVVIGILSGLLGTLWFTSALARVNFIPFSVVYLLQKLQPIFAISAAHFFLKEKLNKNYFKWAALALVSAYFVTFPNGVVNINTGSGTIMAALLALGAAFAWGTSTVFSKMLLRETTHTIATGLRFIFTSVFALLAVFVLKKQALLFDVNLSQISQFIFIALSTGMVALWLYYKGLQKTQAKISTLLELVFPLLAVVIDAVLYKVVLAPSQYFAGVVLIYSIVNLSKRNS